MTAGDGSWSARTFAVHGHHYALVEVVGLEPGSVTPYDVRLSVATTSTTSGRPSVPSSPCRRR